MGSTLDPEGWRILIGREGESTRLSYTRQWDHGRFRKRNHLILCRLIHASMVRGVC